MEHKKLIRSTNAQINFLINYMAAHKNFANALNTSEMGSRSIAEEWTYLRGLLKQHGPDKSIDQWKQTWRDIKRKARKQEADISARAATDEKEHVPIVSASTIKVLDTIGREIPPECNVEIKPVREVKPNIKYLTMRRCRHRLPPEFVPKGDLLQAQNQTNALLQKLCDLAAEQNSILKERNQIERRKIMFYRKRR